MYKTLLSSILLIMLAGCSNPYSKFYTDFTGGINVVEDQRFIVGTGKPTLHKGTTPEQDERRMLQDGYVLLGASSFNGAEQDQRAAIQQAKKVHADTVFVYQNYTNTLSGSMPITTPDMQTSSYSGTIYGAGGTASYFGSSTTYGSRTTYMPYNINRYDYLATYWIRARVRLGIVSRDLTDEERQSAGTNKGIYIYVIVKGSPAFEGDLLPGDIVRRFNEVEVIDENHFTALLERCKDWKIRLQILRKGQIVEKELPLMESGYSVGRALDNKPSEPSESQFHSTTVQQDKPTQYVNRMKIKTDASGEPVKDAKGNLVFVPVYEDEK